MERQITLEQIASASIAGLKASMYIAMPGAISSYDPVAQTATVIPMINDPRRNLTTGEPIFEPWGEIQDVPVCWPRMGGYTIVGFLEPNDQVVLEAWDLDPTAWRQQGRSQLPVNPGDLRRLGGNHWRCIPADLTLSSPGHGPNVSAPTQPGLVIGLDGGQPLIKINGTTIQLGATGGDFVALASKVNALITALETWIKTGVAPSGGGTVTYASPAPVPNVGSTLIAGQ